MMFTRKDLVRLLWPMVVEQILAVTIGMADTMMVSRVGEAAVSGISLVDTLNVLLINVFSALAAGGAIVSAQYIGRDDTKNACVAAKQLLYAITVMSMLLMVGCLLGGRHLLHGIFGNVESVVMDNAETYFVLSALSYPFLGIYNAGAALFRSMNNSKVSMFTSLLMNVVNISGNAVLIFGFGMGVAGAGVATLCSRALGAGIMLALITRPANRVHVARLWKPEFHWGMVKSILRVGVPNGLENGMFQIGKILVQSLIVSFGTVAITANAVANNIATLPQIPGNAIGLGMITVVGQCIGAKRYDEAKRYTLKLTGLACAAMGVLYALFFLFLQPILGLYHLSGETLGMAHELMVWSCAVGVLIWALAFVLPNGLRAAGDVKFTMSVSVISMWTARVGLSYVFAIGLHLGLLGVWLAMFADWMVRSAVFLIRFFSGKWKGKRVID